MIRLFLNNREVELNSSVSFAINKQFEDITSPADIKNDWSKTVQIPFTQSNNKLFGELFNVDRLIVEGDSTLMGIYFDPYKKVDFRLQWGDAIIMQGYAKNIDVVKSANGEGHYNITLNGELGKVFQEMKRITFDTTTEDKNYLIDGSKYVEETISKELIYRLWSNEANTDIVLQDKYYNVINPNTGQIHKVSNAKYKVQDILGFVPNNSYEDDFDYTTYQLKNDRTETFAQTLDGKSKSVGNGKDDDGDGTIDKGDDTYQTVVGIAADTIIGEGLLPREIGEYRSYMQLPYIFFNKLFQIFMKKTKEITGYDTDLDSGWFNESNPYWSKIVYMLNPLNTRKSETIENVYDMRLFADTLYQWTASYPPTTHLNFKLNPVQSYSSEEIEIVNWGVTPPVFNIGNAIIAPQNGYKILLQAEALYENSKRLNTRLNKANGLVIEVNIIYNNGASDTNKTLFIDENATVTYNEDLYNNVLKVGSGDTRGAYFTNWELNIPSLYALYAKEGATTARFEVSAYWLNNNSCFDNVHYAKMGNTADVNVKMYVYDNLKHSYAHFTLNDLWNNEYNLFNEILNYCKQYRIGIFCDDINKKLYFKPLSTYFSEYKILDWTDKLDMSKEYHIQPITFENKYLLFNYEKYETELNEKYNEKYGLNFGEYRLSTQYEFNTDEKEIFKHSKVAIPNTDIVLSWSNIYDNLTVAYTLPAEISIYNKDKDKKNVNVFGSMLFYNGLKPFDTTSNLRPVKISDDTILQLSLQKYFYSQDTNVIPVSTYPLLDIVCEENLCTYTLPQENYTYLKDSYNSNTNGIYKNFWENYLNERYNKQNKIVTCYLRLTPYDIANFQYNNFIKIENQLYMVNKIYDYQIDENQTTKVDLITIQDIKGYTNNNFNIFEVFKSNGIVALDNETININTPEEQSTTLYVTSNKPVKVSIVSINEGALEDITINGVDCRNMWEGYEELELSAGSNLSLTISGLAGSDFSITIELDNSKESKTFTIVSVW